MSTEHRAMSHVNNAMWPLVVQMGTCPLALLFTWTLLSIIMMIIIATHLYIKLKNISIES